MKTYIEIVYSGFLFALFAFGCVVLIITIAGLIIDNSLDSKNMFWLFVAIFGISCLYFYKRPERRLRNLRLWKV